jgi:hypothetical protein
LLAKSVTRASARSKEDRPSGNITSILYLEDAGEWSSPVGMF